MYKYIFKIIFAGTPLEQPKTPGLKHGHCVIAVQVCSSCKLTFSAEILADIVSTQKI